MNIRAHVIITGRVQGVFFRVCTRDNAQQLGINGWVKNTHEGNVEALFEGDEIKVKEMIKWCHEGAPHSIVKSVDIKYEKYLNEYNDFKITY